MNGATVSPVYLGKELVRTTIFIPTPILEPFTTKGILHLTGHALWII
jgi:hypothetical protein